MSFAERLKKFPEMGVTFKRPQEHPNLNLCFPRVLMLNGEVAQGVVGIELAPIIAGGIGSLRMLSALLELLEDASGSDEQFIAELYEAAQALRSHLNLTSAASDLAHAEHEASHQKCGEAVH